MIDKGVMPKALEASLYTTYLASAFRSIRFGVNEAHGKGIAIQLNSLLDQRGFVINGDGTFAVNKDRDQGRGRRSDARHHDDSGAKATTPPPRRSARRWASCVRRCRRRSTSSSRFRSTSSRASSPPTSS